MIASAQEMVTPSSATVGHLLDEWLRFCETRGLTPKTIHEYRWHVQKGIVPVLGGIPIVELTAKDIDWNYSPSRTLNSAYICGLDGVRVRPPDRFSEHQFATITQGRPGSAEVGDSMCSHRRRKSITGASDSEELSKLQTSAATSVTSSRNVS